MEVTKERFEDAGEKNEEGIFEFYYSGFIYTFCEDQERFRVRQYDGTPPEASFLEWQIKRGRNWKSQQLDDVPYDNPTFRQAVKHLIEHEHIVRVSVLIHEYVFVDLTKLA